MKQRSFLSVLVLTIFLGACAHHGRGTNQDHMLHGTVWSQTAGEVRALYYQAFNIGKLRLDQDLRYHKAKKPRAVVVDIDETILDNSPYQARNILLNKTYPDGWKDWIDQASAQAFPGAVEFLNYAGKKGVKVFYITNRKIRGFDATLKNLRKVGLKVNKDQLLLRIGSSSKEARRNKVLKTHRIVFFMGDNLGDFAEFFEKKSLKQRNAAVDKQQDQFGKKFIVMPNPMYGDWEGALYKYNFGLSEQEKDAVRRKHLTPML